jgi:ribonuclease Z
MNLTLLGTSCSIPTKERNTAGYFLKFKQHGILLDCGEAIQRQMKIFGIKLSSVTKLLITHWHGDHVLGLGGLLQSISTLDNVDTLEIYGPVGSKKYFEHLFKSMAFELKITLDIKEVTTGVIYEDDELKISTLPMKHRVVCQAYRVEQKDARKRVNSSEAKVLWSTEKK